MSKPTWKDQNWKDKKSPSATAGQGKPPLTTSAPVYPQQANHLFRSPAAAQPAASRSSAVPPEPKNPFNSPAQSQQVPPAQLPANGTLPQPQLPNPFAGTRSAPSQPNQAAPTFPSRVAPTISDDGYPVAGSPANLPAFSAHDRMLQPNDSASAQRSSPFADSLSADFGAATDYPPEKHAHASGGKSPVRGHGTPRSQNNERGGFPAPAATAQRPIARTIPDDLSRPIPPLRLPSQPQALRPDSSDWSAWQSLSVGWRALRRDVSGVLLLYAGVVVVPIPVGVGVLLLGAAQHYWEAAALFSTMILVAAVFGAGTSCQSLAVAQNKVCRMRRMLPGLRETGSIVAYSVLSLVVVGLAIGCLLGLRKTLGLDGIPQQLGVYSLALVLILLLTFLWSRAWFVVPAIMDRRMSLMPAIRRSFDLTEGQSLQFFFVVIAFSLMALVASGSLVIGLFVLVPIMSIARAHIYLTLSQQKPAQNN